MPAMKLLLAACCSSVLARFAMAAYDIAWNHNDNDLTRFVTRPEIRAPLFEVVEHEPGRVTPGYWFVAPYANIVQEKHAARYYQACQTGPAIYDSQGQLIWSGACMFGNQNSCDFRAFTANESTFLSTILTFYHPVDATGHAVILDNSLQVTQSVLPPFALPPFNMHEFLISSDGRTAMYIIQKAEIADVSFLDNVNGARAGLVTNMGIREVELGTNRAVFTWWAHDHMDVSASTYPPRSLNGPFPNGWDWIHLNAIDKNSDGDYLVTARYTDAIYKISGRDGRVIWTLGGKNSSFEMNGFNFSRPHDGRFLSADLESETITMLDNGGCEESKSSDVSSALILKLDMSSKKWTATVQKRWTRPDGGRSQKRGNFQLLPNGNAFVGWSENSYISEHSPDGEILMEAAFVSERFVTYRAYKFNFTSAPAEPPVLKGFAYGEAQDRSVSVYYVSWNGATEVASWEFYSGEGDAFLGRATRTGFETSFHRSSGYAETVYAKAVSASGTVLRTTATKVVERPEAWSRPRTAQDKDELIKQY